MTPDHLDHAGKPCALHAVDRESLLHLATVGSRARSFHHDLASKLQGLVMALDELSELTTEADERVMTAVHSAHESLRETLGLLNSNRELAKHPERDVISIGELLRIAAARVRVSLNSDLPTTTTEVVVSATIHAWALLLDLAAGSRRACTVVASELVEGKVTLELGFADPTTCDDGASVSVAAFVFARDGGELRCTPDGARVFVTLTVASE